jgi:uncharacterized protein YjhX (UPF0386 family)
MLPDAPGRIIAVESYGKAGYAKGDTDCYLISHEKLNKAKVNSYHLDEGK